MLTATERSTRRDYSCYDRGKNRIVAAMRHEFHHLQGRMWFRIDKDGFHICAEDPCDNSWSRLSYSPQYTTDLIVRELETWLHKVATSERKWLDRPIEGDRQSDNEVAVGFHAFSGQWEGHPVLTFHPAYA